MNLMSNSGIHKSQKGINLIANIISYSANIIISFVLTPFLINALGKETYSFYPMANTVVSYMSVLTNAMNTVASRFVTVHLVNDKTDEANKYYSSTLAANLIMSCVLALLMTLVVVFLDCFMAVPVNSVAAIKGLFSLVFASALINVASAVFGIATFAKNRIDLRSLRELVTAALRLILFFVLYQVLPPSIVYVGIVTLIVALVNICFQVGYTNKLLPEIRIERKHVSWRHTKELLLASCWNAVNTFGNTLLAGMSMILANILYGATASGTYSIVNTVPQFICGVICMLVGVFYPVITYKYAQNDRVGLLSEIKNAQNIVGLFGCAVISVFSALASDFFALWTPGEDSKHLSILSFVTIFPHFIISCMWSLTNVIVVVNKVKIPAIFTLASGMANVSIAIIVYMLYDPELIFLPLISSVLQVIWIGVFIPQYVCCSLKVKWYTFYPPLLKALLCSAITMGLVTAVKHFFILDSWIKLLLFGGGCGVVALVLFAVIMLESSHVFAIGRLLKKMLHTK